MRLCSFLFISTQVLWEIKNIYEAKNLCQQINDSMNAGNAKSLYKECLNTEWVCKKSVLLKMVTESLMKKRRFTS